MWDFCHESESEQVPILAMLPASFDLKSPKKSPAPGQVINDDYGIAYLEFHLVQWCQVITDGRGLDWQRSTNPFGGL